MPLIVGNIAYLALSVCIVCYSLANIFASGTMRRELFIMLLFAALVAVPSAISQTPLDSIKYSVKLMFICFIFSSAFENPKIIVRLYDVVLFVNWIPSLIVYGYIKDTEIPPFIILTAPLLLSGARKNTCAKILSGNYVLSAILLLQGVYLHSRTSAAMGLILLALIATKRYRSFAYKITALFPAIYLGFMSLIAGYLIYSQGFFMKIAPTSSNIERSVMLLNVLAAIPSHPAGISQVEFSASVNSIMEIVHRAAYSVTSLDPHNVLAFISIYSGWIGVIVTLGLLLILAKMSSAIQDGSEIIISIWVLLIAKVMLNTFSVDTRLAIGICCGIIVSYSRRQSKGSLRAIDQQRDDPHFI